LPAIANPIYNTVSLDDNQALSLQTVKNANDDFAHRSRVDGELVMNEFLFEANTSCGLYASRVGFFQKPTVKDLPDFAKRKRFNKFGAFTRHFTNSSALLPSETMKSSSSSGRFSSAPPRFSALCWRA
jgi:hypothetical protein